MVNEINRKLEDLYKSKYTNLTNQLSQYNESCKIPTDEATNPLMLRVDEEWLNADFKIMLFGQENNFWGGECDKGRASFCGKVDEVIDIYETFYLNKKRKYGPFWNEFKRIVKMTKKEGKKISFLWNNIVKIGRRGKGCVPAIHNITKDNFNVIVDEIKILKPDVLIFLTGPDYDEKIKDGLGDFSKIQIGNFDSDNLCELKFNIDYSLTLSVRINHPNFLYFQGKAFKDSIINELLKIIKEKI